MTNLGNVFVRLKDYFWRQGVPKKVVLMVVKENEPDKLIPLSNQNSSEEVEMNLKGIAGLVHTVKNYFWTQGLPEKSLMMVVSKDDPTKAIPVTEEMLKPTIGAGPITVNSAEKKYRGVMYWPRKSPSMDMWRELDRGTITWDEIETDLDQLKLFNINLIRVFTFYDHEYRIRGTLEGPTDGEGNYNEFYYTSLDTFIKLCAARDMKVVVTLFQEMKGLRVTDDWDWLEDELEYHKEHLTKIMTVLEANKKDVAFYNLKNEPDGFGVWANPALATRVLTWLDALKNHAKVTSDIPCAISSTTHDNAVYVFPTAPQGARSILEISEILAFNTFRYADNGSWIGTTYRTQLEFTLRNNPTDKPVIFWECGYPANYDGQGDGLESIVPTGGEFDRPQGSSPQTPHTPQSQYISVSEGIAWAEAYDTIGVMVWSAYDHQHPTLNTYRDNFGIIDKNGIPLPAIYALSQAFTNQFPASGKRLSLNQGTITGDGRINGLNGWNTVDVTKNVVAGVYLGAGGTWTSDRLPYKLPCSFEFALKPREAFGDEGVAVILETSGRSITIKYKDYGVKKWFIIDTNTQAELAQTETVGNLNPGEEFLLAIDLTSTDLQIRHNSLLLTLNNPVAFSPYEYFGQVRLTVVNSAGGSLEIGELLALGQGEITRNENFYNAKNEYVRTSNL